MKRARRRLENGAAAAIVFTMLGTIQAQGRFPPASFTNLQVLPATSSAGDVIGTMKTITQALGVRCQYCHVGQEGLPLDRFDFVSDENPKKGLARTMMRMVRGLNENLAAALPGGDRERVTCYTCHRGQARPARSPDGAPAGAVCGP
ncbi:MAG: c-type cytochrome [Vicinamibacterales bacterium]